MAPPTKLTFRIPTYERLGTSPPADAEKNASQTALDWFHQFSAALSSHDSAAVMQLLCEDAMWRDTNALTWDIRTFDGAADIKALLDARLGEMEVGSLTWMNFVRYQQVFPDTAWIISLFSFETSVGLCKGVVRLVYTSDGSWKGFTVYTTLDELKAFPELIGARREKAPISGASWLQSRERQLSAEMNPPVLIVGAGQSGLMLAARLKYLGVESILIERDARIGDSWRKRYDSLCLHFPVWYDHMPYIPFPPTWPKYTPGPKMADWLECYATLLELNVWTSSRVLSATQDATGKWTVRVQRENADTEHIFRVNHLVLATGQGDGVPRIPDIPNHEEFNGSIIHSTSYKNPKAYLNKRVLVVGAGNSGHDVAADMARNGVDVTLLQRSSTFIMDLDKGWNFLGAVYSESGPPVEIADLLTQSMPHLLLENGMAQRGAKAIVASQQAMIDGLKSVGYNASLGFKDAGILLSLKQKGGGHHFDTGAASLIIQKAIKVKSGTQISKFKSNGVYFEDGTGMDIDAVIYATGCGDTRDFVRAVCGDAVADQCPPMVGVNKEGEISWYRTLPVKGLWYMYGNISFNRFYSKHVAMYIKAQEEGLIKTRYDAEIGPDCISLRI